MLLSKIFMFAWRIRPFVQKFRFTEIMRQTNKSYPHLVLTAIVIFISILAIFRAILRELRTDHIAQNFAYDAYSSQINIYNELLSKIKNTEYRYFIDLYKSSDFKKQFKRLNEEEQEKIIGKMFHHPNNKPKPKRLSFLPNKFSTAFGKFKSD